jgi:hypothetical protein
MEGLNEKQKEQTIKAIKYLISIFINMQTIVEHGRGTQAELALMEEYVDKYNSYKIED